MLARQAPDARLSRRSPQPSAYGSGSQLAAGRSPQPAPPAATSATSLNTKAVRVVGTEGTAYEAMCKRVLGRRLLRAFSLALFATLILWTTSLSLTGGLSFVPSFANGLRNTASSAAVFLLCVLPTLVLRKLLINQPELTTSSVGARARALAGAPSSRAAAVVFAVCGGLLAFVWAVVSQLAAPNVKLGVFASTAKHPVQLNERLIAVILSNVSLGLAYASRELWREAFLPALPRDIVPLQGLILGRLARVPAQLGLPLVHSVAFSAAYVGLRKPVLRFLLSWFGVLVRPYVATFLRPTHRSIDAGLLGRIAVLHLTTVALWEAASALLAVYMAQPMLVSHHSATPAKCLLAGLGASSAHLRRFAQFELAHLAVASPERRLDLFSDMAGPTTAWADVWRAEMVLLGQSFQTLSSRGLAGAVPAGSTVTAASGSEAPADGRQQQQQQQQQQHLVPKADPAIFKHAPRTALDSLSSSPTQTALPAVPPASQPAARSSATAAAPSSVPAIFTQKAHSAGAPPVAAPPPAPAASASSSSSILSSVLGPLKAVWAAVWRGVPAETRAAVEGHLAPVRTALLREAARGTARRALPHRDVDMLTIQTLSALVSASLAEDPYGQVQRDIPRTLEALTAFLAALEALHAELQAPAALPGAWAEQGAATMAVLKDDVEPVLDATREGIRQIVETFREHLASAFRLPPHVVQALEQFVD